MTLPLGLPVRVFVRSVSDAYPRCLRSDAEVVPDVEEARRQHERYVALLEGLGVPVVQVPACHDAPDACFVEDTAVLFSRVAVVTRPGAPSRQAETTGIASVLSRYLTVHAMEGPATLDGGDVLRVGQSLFVGRSERTNDAGIAFLRNVAKEEGMETLVVPVRGGLHLKSACTLASEDTLVVDPTLLGDDVLREFEARGLRLLRAPEPMGANVLRVGAHVLVSEDAPGTATLLRQRGHRVLSVAVGEFHKGDGALTCLSLRQPAEGTYAP